MISQENKVKAFMISSLWMEIAIAATQQIRKVFQLNNSNGHWITTNTTPSLESNLDVWRIGTDESGEPPIEHALFFVQFWRDVAYGKIPEYYDDVDKKWYEMGRWDAPCFYSDSKDWRVLPPKAKEFQTEPYKNKAWKRTDNGEFTEDPIVAADWELEGYTLQVFALVEQA